MLSSLAVPPVIFVTPFYKTITICVNLTVAFFNKIVETSFERGLSLPLKVGPDFSKHAFNQTENAKFKRHFYINSCRLFFTTGVRIHIQSTYTFPG